MQRLDNMKGISPTGRHIKDDYDDKGNLSKYKHELLELLNDNPP